MNPGLLILILDSGESPVIFITGVNTNSVPGKSQESLPVVGL